MPNRIIKESIWTSPNLNNLSDLAERHFYRILPLPDDHGCCELTPRVVNGRCYPLKDISNEEIDSWQQELEDNGVLIRWDLNGRQYGIFTTFSKHQRIRSLHERKTPAPPPYIQAKCDSIEASRVEPDSQQHFSTDNEDNNDPLIIPYCSLQKGLELIKSGGMLPANKRLFVAELKRRGLENLLEVTDGKR